MNIHNPEGMQVPDFIPTFDAEGGFIFITVKESHRLALETNVERLINMLDDMDPDPDLEPDLADWLGGDNRDDREGDYEGHAGNGDCDFEPSLGWTECLAGRDGTRSTGHVLDVDLEEACEDEGGQVDEEYTLGWSETESAAGRLRAGTNSGDGEAEPELGWTEELDQERRMRSADGWHVEDGEPDLGFVGIGTGWQKGEGTDDREQADDSREGDDEKEPLLGWSEQCSQGRNADTPEVQRLDGFDNPEEGPSGYNFTGEGYKVHQKELKRLKLTKRDMLGDPRAERLHIMPDGKQFRTFVYADDDAIVPEYDHRAHYLAAHGMMPSGRA